MFNLIIFRIFQAHIIIALKHNDENLDIHLYLILSPPTD